MRAPSCLLHSLFSCVNTARISCSKAAYLVLIIATVSFLLILRVACQEYFKFLSRACPEEMMSLRVLLTRKNSKDGISAIINRHIPSFLRSDHYSRWTYAQMGVEPWLLKKPTDTSPHFTGSTTQSCPYSSVDCTTRNSWLSSLESTDEKTCLLIVSTQGCKHFPIVYASSKAKQMFIPSKGSLIGDPCPFISSMICSNAKELSRLRYSLRQGIPLSSTTKSMSANDPSRPGILLSKPLFDEDGMYSLAVLVYVEEVSSESFDFSRTLICSMPNVLSGGS